ncbi:MAG: hypothetical protein AB7E72_03950 [Lysobacterales bacterium]
MALPSRHHFGRFRSPVRRFAASPRRVGLRRSIPLLLLLLATLAEAAPFRLISGTLDGGGSHSQGARFSAEGTVGQPDAGLAQGSRFRVESGFWPAATATTAPSDSIFRNSFED